MKPELKELLLEIKTKINDDKLFRDFVGEILNEANYNNYYEQSVVDEGIAEQLVEIYFIENYSSDEEVSDLKEKIMKILFFLEGQEELIKEYAYFVETKVSKIVTELN
ncbi:hypothetical protein M1771_01200 [Spiroplasma citri]|uniref:Uncharacterized protein n=1 Tax=Spiroplasma citri TaxID=2133 RepID=A0AAX3SZN5_SPICI|nr:hypothetical protein [Spiroplasma citri]WFG96666.1 hypothetical protein M0C40_01210 [Spiroplasma citri]WFH00559.1 hypothetical protein M1771_01200 [Spiroplasma citri]